LRTDQYAGNSVDTLGTGTAPARRPWRSPSWRRLALAGSLLVLIAIIAGVVWGTTHPGAPVTARSTPTTTALPTPHLAYQSDWSHGADGWNLPASARIIGGHLLLDGENAISIQIPYTPPTRNYTIEMDFQIKAARVGGHFGLTAFDAAGIREYLAQMQCTPMHEGAWNPSLGGCPGAILVAAQGGSYPSGLWTSDYVIHPGAQTFTVEITGDTVTFCPSGDCLVPVNGATPLGVVPRLMIEDRAVTLLITRIAISVAG
jgi:hypothetical protein